jgi:hypothetical protein
MKMDALFTKVELLLPRAILMMEEQACNRKGPVYKFGHF